MANYGAPSSWFIPEFTKAQTCDAAMDTGPFRSVKNSQPQRQAVGLSRAPSQ